MAVHQTLLEEVAVPDGDGMHGLSQVKWGLCCGLTQDSWQFWQLTAGKWLICLLLPPFCLSVCLSQAVNPLSEETHKKRVFLVLQQHGSCSMPAAPKYCDNTDK